MTYNLNIDQEFAVINDLSLVQVSTLAAFMTLPLWSKTVAIDGNVWYQYSEEQMAKDFPLLFGIPKRCYKNIAELCGQGFVELTKLGRTKFVRFTNKCANWGKKKDQNWTESPKTDQISPKTDQPYNSIVINNNSSNIDYNIDDNIKTADGGLFASESNSEKVKVSHPRRTSEASCLFDNSRYADFKKFSAEFTAPEFANVDIAYYYYAVADWSRAKGRKMKDWIATARNFIRSDMEKGKLHKLSGGELPPDAIEYLKNMAD